MGGDYIAFGDLVLNDDKGAASPTGATYTVKRVEGLAALPNPRLVLSQLAGVPGAVLSDAEDDYRVVVLEGEVYAPSHELLLEELERFKALLSVQNGLQYLTWTPLGRAARRIEAILQNNGGAILDVNEGDRSAPFRLEFICPDPFFCATTATTLTAGLTASGQTVEVTNQGNVFTEPTVRFKPTSVKTGSYAYRRWVPLYNRVDQALIDYPIEITTEEGTGFDHAALVTAGKAQADGDDLRVFVDGEEVDRWLDGPNTTTCKVWVNFDLQPGVSVTLATAFLSGDNLASITFDDVSDLPNSGILYNADTGEAFTYTAKDSGQNKVTGVTRAAKGTSASAGTVGDTFWWVEKDIWLLYGNASVSAPDVDDDYKPAFNLSTSTNTSWDYDYFGEDDGLRAAQWAEQVLGGQPSFRHGNHGAVGVDPWEEMGIVSGYDSARVYVYNPCGITNANFTNGERYTDSGVEYIYIRSSKDGSSWTTEHTLPGTLPPDFSKWLSWSRDEALASDSLYVAVEVEGQLVCEFSDCSLTLDSSNTPATGLGAEQGNYSLELTLTLVVEGEDQEAIHLEGTIGLNDELEIDCERRTVTNLKDNSNQFQMISLRDPELRSYWLRLPGHWDGGKSCQLRVDENGLTGMTVTVEFHSRYL